MLITSEHFLAHIYPTLSKPPQSTLMPDGYHVGAFRVAASQHAVDFLKTGERDYEFLRRGKVIGRLRGMVTDLVSYETAEFCASKERVNTHLRHAGLQVPEEQVFPSSALGAALEYARGRDFDIVVKPVFGAGGRGVRTDIRDEHDFRAAWNHAVENLAPKRAPKIAVQAKCPGIDIRAVVVAGRVSCVVTRMPANVLGDGRANVLELVQRKNAVKSLHPYHGRYLISIDERTKERLARRGLSLATILPCGVPLVLAEVNNIHAGGDACDITDLVSSGIRRVAEEAARAIQGLDVVGVDLLVSSLELDGEARVIEMNVPANFSIHLAPFRGQPRNPAVDIVVEMLKRREPSPPIGGQPQTHSS